jgi:hypothetical protein
MSAGTIATFPAAGTLPCGGHGRRLVVVSGHADLVIAEQGHFFTGLREHAEEKG